MTTWIKTATVLLSSMLAACTQKVQDQPYAEYLNQVPGASFNNPEESERLEPFLDMFTQLSPESVDAHISRVYAEKLYFNDTFHVFRDRDTLKNYFMDLTKTAQTDVRALDYAEAGDQIWLRWKMRTQFKVLWKDVDVTSIGMTHMIFDTNNQIVVHQDYWDGVEGFYAHLPVLGGMVRFVRSGLGGDS